MADTGSGITNGASGAKGVESTLESLRGTLATLVRTLKEPAIQAELAATLHDPNTLPDKELGSLAGDVVDLLDEAKQMLQPDQLVLADHFMGWSISHEDGGASCEKKINLDTWSADTLFFPPGYYLSSKSLVAAVELKVPDILSAHGKAMTVAELAEAAAAREDRLRPVLRLLHNNGIFAYDAARDAYANNSRSELLRRDHWTQWHTWVELYATEFYDMARGIPASLRADAARTAAQINYDTDDSIFAYFEKQGWVPRVHRVFGASQMAQAPGILADYPWHEVADGGRTVLDVGGGGGALVASLLRAHPAMRGGVLDLPAVVEHTRPFFHGEGGQYADVGDRVAPGDLVAGDFLAGPIPRYEVYVIKWCLHNWLDPEAVRILRNIREAMIPGEQSRLVVLDAVLRDGAMGRLAQYGDVQMLMTAKGKERTEEEWQRLADASGWKIKKFYTLRNAWVSAIELRI